MLRKISNSIEKEDLKQVLKETIVLNRIKCDDLIHGISRYFIENKTLFILMENLELQESLSSVLSLNVDDSNTLNKKYMWCRDIAFAVDYLHTHNQPHLKIYPKNIFVKNDRLILGEIGFKIHFTNYLPKETNQDHSHYYPIDFLNSQGLKDFKCFDIWYD